MKLRSTLGILCDRKIPIKLKGKFHNIAIRPTMFYGTKYWSVKK